MHDGAGSVVWTRDGAVKQRRENSGHGLKEKVGSYDWAWRKYSWWFAGDCEQRKPAACLSELAELE